MFLARSSGAFPLIDLVREFPRLPRERERGKLMLNAEPEANDPERRIQALYHQFIDDVPPAGDDWDYSRREKAIEGLADFVTCPKVRAFS